MKRRAPQVADGTYAAFAPVVAGPLFALLVAVAGCAHAPRSRPPERTVAMDPVVFHAQPGGAVDVVDAEGLFAQAGAQFQAHDFAAAVAGFERIARDYADSRFVVPSLYNAALALEQLHDLPGAIARYRRITVEHPSDPGALDAWFRMGRVQLDAGRADDAVHTWDAVLARADLSLGDRLEAMARRGAAQFALKQWLAAEHTFREQLAYYHAHETEERLDDDFFVAMSAYYLGEVAHEQYRAMPVRLPEKQLARDLEAKARLLLVAQARYIDAMRVDNAEWATAAGFQIGALYREFYDDLVGAPVPPSLSGEARDVYREEVRKQVKNLLQKAIAVHEKNVLMAERIGEKNDWVRRSNEQLDQLRKLLEPGPMPAAGTLRSEPTPPAAPLPRPNDDVRGHVTM